LIIIKYLFSDDIVYKNIIFLYELRKYLNNNIHLVKTKYNFNYIKNIFYIIILNIMGEVGFEPTRFSTPGLKSGSLDHSDTHP
jgi:hypothetical protein